MRNESSSNNYTPFPVQSTGEVKFFLNTETILNHDFKTSPIFSAHSWLSDCVLRYFTHLSHHIPSILSLLFNSFVFLLYNFFSHQYSILSATLILKFLVFWKVIDHYVTDVLLVRAKRETVKQRSKNAVDWKIEWLAPREGQPVTALPPKSSYSNINAVIYPVS